METVVNDTLVAFSHRAPVVQTRPPLLGMCLKATERLAKRTATA